MNESENLKFRRQFILSDNHINILEEWNRFSFRIGSKEWNIKYHPDLEFSSQALNNGKIIMLGYILDPQNPDFNNQQILSEIAAQNSLESVLKSTNSYNGRFIILYGKEDKLYIFNDATGFREIYYHAINDHYVCGSTPNIIAEALNLTITKNDDILAFFKSKHFRDNDNTWLGYKTLYDNVLHLAPNHYLDLKENRVVRFWPDQRLSCMDVDESAKACAEILKGTLLSAKNRYELHMGITAGWDTRLLLAASNAIHDQVYYYVNKTDNLTVFNKDIRIPQSLSKKLRIKIHVLEITGHVDQEFKRIFYGNNMLAHEKLLPVFYNVYKKGWDKTVTISGAMGNGLARIYMPVADNITINGSLITNMTNYKGFRYIETELSKWCKEVTILCEKNNISIMDLYQWEQENANWASLTASEQDICREEIRPFNNRKLIESFWSAGTKNRYQYYPEIYIKMMRLLWKDVLSKPINPSYKSFLYTMLRIVGLERKVYNSYKKRKIMRCIDTQIRYDK